MGPFPQIAYTRAVTSAGSASLEGTAAAENIVTAGSSTFVVFEKQTG